MEEDKNKADKESVAAPETAPESKSSKGGNKSTIIAVVIVALLILGALEFTGSTSFLESGKALATVNGEKITQDEFDTRLNQILSSPQAQSFNLDDPELRSQIEEQVLDEIINTRLLLQAAISAGYTATEESVQEEYDLIIDRLGGAEFLAEELENGGLTDNLFRKNINDQLVIQQYINANVNFDEIIITDEEISQFYEQISGQEGVPPLSEIESQIEGQLKSQKEQTAIGVLITSLRTDGAVEILE